MSTLIPSQLRDALTYIDGLGAAIKALPDEPKWDQGGLHLLMPDVIPLKTDYPGDTEPVAWLVANDFDGYDLTTTNPHEKEDDNG